MTESQVTKYNTFYAISSTHSIDRPFFTENFCLSYSLSAACFRLSTGEFCLWNAAVSGCISSRVPVYLGFVLHMVITFCLAFQYPSPIVVCRSPVLKHIIRLLTGLHAADTVRLFSKKHCDYFNRSESLLSSLKVSTAMLPSARLSLKKGKIRYVRVN